MVCSPDSNAPKTNKRFLSSIIRNTDDHNKTILRAQALAAQEVKREREEQEKKERRARAEEAVAAERTRRSMGASRRDSFDRWDKNDSDRKRKMRSWDEEEDEYPRDKGRESDLRRGHHRRSRHSERESREDDEKSSHKSTRDKDHGSSRHRHRDGETGEDHDRHRHSSRDREHDHHSSHRRRHHRSRPASPKPSRRHRSEPLVKDDEKPRTSRKHKASVPSNDEEERQYKKIRTSKGTHREDDEKARALNGKHRGDYDTEIKPLPRSRSGSRSGSPSPDPQPISRSDHLIHPKHGSSSSRTARSRSSSVVSLSQSPSSQSRSQLPSKMDKYFEESYDPRLDVAPLLSTSSIPKVPATGLIDNAEFEGWDAMLELIRARREDKEEKKRLERMGLGTKKGKDKKSKVDVGAVNDRWKGGNENIMDIEYKKKGSVREWDLGKEGF